MDINTGDDLARQIDHRRLAGIHECVVPRCGERATEAFAAAEDGRLAGRFWHEGEMIDLCALHGRDVRRAVYGAPDQVADWLKLDLDQETPTSAD